MDHSDALPFIEALAFGFDPLTGHSLAEESPLHHPQVIRALFTAARLIESQSPPDSSVPSVESYLSRVGHSWDKDEDQRLAYEFHAGVSFAKIAVIHQRTRGAILSRLVRLGYVKRKQSPYSGSSSTARKTKRPDEKWWRKERPQAGKRWTHKEDAELQRDLTDGLSIEEIAYQLGRGKHGVDVRLTKLGIHPDNKE